jgi:GNAT superfamily N-acetyltransferase
MEISKADFDTFTEENYGEYIALLHQLYPASKRETLKICSFKKFKDLYFSILFRSILLLGKVGENYVASGTLFIHPRVCALYAPIGYIEDAVVSEKERGKGYGKQIIQALTKEAKKLGCYKILLISSDSNLKFYKNNNYIPYENCCCQHLI